MTSSDLAGTRTALLQPGGAAPPAADGTRAAAHVAIVFPPDTRQRVADAGVVPFRSQGELRMTFPDGQTFTGTATLIDDRHLLTAAHNVYGEQNGGFARNVWFAPQRNGDDPPHGFVAGARVFVTEEYATLSPPDPDSVPVEDYTLYTEDYAVVRLAAPVALPALPLIAATDGQLGGAVQITGYPGDKPRGTMWTAAGPLTGMDEHFLFYRIDTFSGESGAGLVARLPTAAGHAVVGVHVAGDPRLGTNFGVRLDDDKLARIGRWIDY